MSAFSHYSRVVVHPLRFLEFLRIMTEVAKASRAETECDAFVVLKSTTEEHTYCISSVWTTHAAWEAHKTTEHFNQQALFIADGGVLSVVYAEEYYVANMI
jgi:quinol monooxygenase YgiN